MLFFGIRLSHLCISNKNDTKMRQLSTITPKVRSTKSPTYTVSPNQLNLLNAIEQIVELSEASNLNEDFFTKAERFISYVSQRLSLSPIQAVLLSLFIDKSNDYDIRIKDLSTHIKCRTVKFIQYTNEIDILEQRKFIYRRRKKKERGYYVPQQVIDALIQNEVYIPKLPENLSCDAFFTVLEQLFEQYDNDEITYIALTNEIQILFEYNKHLIFVQKVKKYNLDSNDLILFIFFCHLFVNNSDDNISCYDFDELYPTKSIYRSQRNALLNGKSDLFDLKLIENPNNNGFADREAFKLTDSAKKELLIELNIEINQAKNLRGILLHTDLIQKKLYYNQSEQQQIRQLCSLLRQKRFKEIEQSLHENGMRKGFTCLFYGIPGTGKTETVYQLAKQTGRNILQVNISEIKSCWVGESEKNIKELFDRYHNMVKETEIAPILLFNEADAIIGKRQENAERPVEKMENAIQNIILQEMENMEGILIATTNLTQNMDKAFERRFLYKIKFDKPGLEAQCLIWQSMIPNLNEMDVRELATRYNFSGGQIENIARKQVVETILSGKKKINIDVIKQFCENEQIIKQERKRIGF